MKVKSISCGDYIARINVSRGGNCISLCNVRHACKILREPDYDRGIENPYIYGMPILFPANRISNGMFEFEGRNYVFPINEKQTNCSLHGSLHDMQFEIISHENNSIVLEYAATREKPYLQFPHEFVIRMKYSLSEMGMLHEVTIYNHSSENMPVIIGFHTTFSLPYVEGSKKNDLFIKIDIREEYERSKSSSVPTGRLLDYDAVSKQLLEGSYVPNKPVSRHFRSAESGTMYIIDSKKGVAVKYESCPEMPYRMIYGEGTDYICLEPQNTLVDCVNSPFPREKTGFTYLKPNESKKYWFKIGIIRT